MRRVLTVAAVSSISFLMAGGVSAAPLSVPSDTIVQKSDYYCGPECQRHRYWEHRRAERREEWRESRHHPYHTYSPYYRGY